MDIVESRLVKSLCFPLSCTEIALAAGRRYLLCTGVYKPSVKIYDLNNLALKSERHLVVDAVKMLPLSDNGEKLCVMRPDRYVEFHAKYGRHELIRLPTMCLEMCLNEVRAELIAGGAGSSLYRFNLEQGRFLRSYSTTLEEVASISTSSVNGLIAVGGEDKVQFIDQRCREAVKTVHYEDTVTALSLDGSGIGLGVGMEDGSVYFHDLRTRKELLTVKHTGAVKKIKFSGKRMLSMDGGAVLISERSGVAGEVRGEAVINTFDVDGGVLFVGYDNGEIKTFICHELGDVPRWCQVLENR
jgi:ribosome biogenesis protein ENP2